MIPIFDKVTGPAGTAEPIPFDLDDPEAAETVASWLLTAPAAHPVWTQYALVVVRLRDDVPGFPPPHRRFVGATHELLVLALNPDGGPYTGAALAEGKVLPYLMPPNLVEQFEATDHEMQDLASLAAQAVAHGILNPDTDGRAAWLPVLVKTLAHTRGEEHEP